MKTLARLADDPTAPKSYRFASAVGDHLLIVPYSRIFDLPPSAISGTQGVSEQLNALIDELARPEAEDEHLDLVVAPGPQAISLNVSSSCNLSCGYCYAARGAFDGAQPKPMNWEIAKAAIDALIAAADVAHPITVGFLGGEPFVNRTLIHRCVRYATEVAQARCLDIRFSVTTNGTLLNDADIALVRDHKMAVTVSVDGGKETHDRQRPALSKSSSFDSLQRAIQPLLRDPGHAQIAARATVTRQDFDLAGRFDAILALGFTDVGFSPLRNGGLHALRDNDWPVYLASLIAVAQSEVKRVHSGQSIRLSNLAIALKQLARGASSPYPCGAGGGYFSVAADGRWYACHRAIGSSEFEMGDSTGLDEQRRSRFLKARHVHAQTACRTCWARYLCSGSCHQEASARTDSSCGFVRGWLEFCLSTYCELSHHE